jgi:hypothetical protein
MSAHRQLSRHERRKLGFENQAFTFGAFVAGAYRVWGKRKAKGIIHLAVRAHMIEFCGKQRYIIF